MRRTTPAAPPSGRWPSSPRSGWRCAGRWRTTSPSASSICPRRTPWRGDDEGTADGETANESPADAGTANEAPANEAPANEAKTDGETGGQEDASGTEVRIDPIGVLAGAAGYDDPERWWEDVIEHRGAEAEAGPGTGEPVRTRWRRSRRWPRRWARCARPTATGAMTAIRYGRPICGSGSGPRDGSSGTTSPWCAAPGTYRPWRSAPR